MQVLAFSHLSSEELVVVLLVHLLFLGLDVLVLLDVAVDFLELLGSLLDGLLELHGVLGRVSQCLLKVSNLS